MPSAKSNISLFFSQLGSFFRRYWIATAIVLIAIVLIIAWVAGYRVSTGFTFVRVGTLQITDIPAGAQVFVDEGARGTSSTGTLSLPLVPGTHTVIVSADGYNPWESMVAVPTNKVTAIDPILFPTRPNIEPLSINDTIAAKAAIAASKLPTYAAPLITGCASVTVERNQIIADTASSTPGCSATPPAYLCSNGSCAATIVFSPIAPIRAVVAYPGRTDALLVAAGDTLYAIGLDPRTPQAFSELLTAPNVMVATLPGGAAVAQNSTGIYGLAL